ncbi:MAG: hypothetical protein WBD20_25450 [Pirellulaceae bacterium]
MSKTRRKKDLAKRRKRLNHKQGKLVESGLRIDHAATDISRYESDAHQVIAGGLSYRRTELLLNEAIENNDYAVIRLAAQGLIDLGQADAEVFAISGITAMGLFLPRIALRDLERACRRNESGPMVDQARAALPQVRQAVAGFEIPQRLRQLHTPEELDEAGYLNDRVQELMHRFEVDLAYQFAMRSLKRFDKFLPLRNNVVHLAIIQGEYAEAKRHSDLAMELFSDDVFTISNAAMLDWIHNDLPSCRERLNNVGVIPDNRREGLSNLMEVAYKANFPETVLELWQKNEAIQNAASAGHFARDAKLVAWAHGRLEDSERAIKMLKSIAHAKRDEEYQELLADMKQRAEWHEGGSPLPAEAWFTGLFNQIQAIDLDDTSKMQKVCVAFATRHPQLVAALWDRGPATIGRLLLEACLDQRALPSELLDVIEAFASGRWGQAVNRLIAKGIAHQHGRTIPRFWQRAWFTDEFTFVDLTTFSQSRPERSKEVNDLAVSGMRLMHEGNARASEQAYRKALAIEPNSRDLRGNIIPAIAFQGRRKEAEELTEALYRDFPDYFFAKIQWATVLISQKRTNEAESIAEEILQDRRTWHVTEASAYAQLKAKLFAFHKDRSAANNMLNWAKIYQDLVDTGVVIKSAEHLETQKSGH